MDEHYIASSYSALWAVPDEPHSIRVSVSYSSNISSNSALSAHFSAQASVRTLGPSRINSIDMMRGLVMLIMLLAHVRERFYLHMQVSDPMDLSVTSWGLFLSRFAAHFCAPVFVFLTGVSAWLYANRSHGQPRSARVFLIKRGLFLIALEIVVINISWMGNYHTLWLRVLWVIGLSMLTLAALINLPSPWMGVIVLGYVAGPIFSQKPNSNPLEASLRQQTRLKLGLSCWGIFALLRRFNIYGETLPWQAGVHFGETLMSVFNLTKYPPSLSFLLVTLGGMFFCLVVFE